MSQFGTGPATPGPDDDEASPAPRRALTSPEPPPAEHTGGARRLPVLVAVGVLVVALVVGAVVWTRGRGATTAEPAVASSTSASPTPTPTPSVTPTPTPTPTPRPRPAATKPAVPAGCAPRHTPMADPKSFSIARLGVSSKMLSLGWDRPSSANRAPLAPPLDSPTATTDVGWFDQGPKLGAAKGNAILTIHTFHVGGALGNKLQASFKPGDLVSMTDADGKKLCWTLERELKVWVKDYDPNSNVMHDPDGKPQAVIVICWDYDASTKDWDSRLLYYLKPVGATG